MRKIGISIFPSNVTLEESIAYLDLANKYKYSRLFVCLLSIMDKNVINQTKLRETKTIIAHASKLGFEVFVDVSKEFMEKMNLSFEDLTWFKELGVSGLRLDVGFGGAQEALMSYNKENILIELNVSENSLVIDNIMSFKANRHNIVGCHNFYPKRNTGITREIFEQCSLEYKKYGLRVAAFVNAKSAAFGPWQVTEGLCTLEEHRDLPIDVQAKDLFYSNFVDDVIIANCFASEAELKALAEASRDLITLDVKLEYNISDIEAKIAFEELHVFRGDAGAYVVRSTMPRVKYKEHSIKENNTRNLTLGDVFIENDAYKNYKGELNIAVADFPNKGGSNVIGRVLDSNITLLRHLEPWSKFKLKQVS